MDKLKNLIDESRQEFEEFKAPEELWVGISQQLKQTKEEKKSPLSLTSKGRQDKHKTVKMYSFSRPMLIKVAASILVLLVAGTSWVFYQINKLDGESPQLSKTEAYYDEIFHAKLAELKQYEQDDLYDPDLLVDIQELETIYNDLKNDLREDANNEQVVEAMIRNYRIRIELLERMLGEIKANKKPHNNRINQNEEQNNGKEESI
jgi:hypothetical protein